MCQPPTRVVDHDLVDHLFRHAKVTELGYELDQNSREPVAPVRLNLRRVGEISRQ